MVVRALADGLAKTAEAMRFTSMSAVMAPGVTELEVAVASEALLRQVNPLLGPMIEDMLRLELRRTMETEAVTAGSAPRGCRCRVPARSASRSRIWSASPGWGRRCRPRNWRGWPTGSSTLTHEVVAPAGPVHQDRSATR